MHCQHLSCKLLFFFALIFKPMEGEQGIASEGHCCLLSVVADYKLLQVTVCIDLESEVILERTHHIVTGCYPLFFFFFLALCRPLLVLQLVFLFISTRWASSLFSKTFISCRFSLPCSRLWHISKAWSSSESDFCSLCALFFLSLVLKNTWSVVCLPAVVSNLCEEAVLCSCRFGLGKYIGRHNALFPFFTASVTLKHLRSLYCLTFPHL